MNLLRRLQRQGATGSIARWAYKFYTLAQDRHPTLDEPEICRLVFEHRYEAIAPLKSEKEAFERIRSEPRYFEDLPSLCTAIAEIEFDITLAEDTELWLQVMEVMEEELAREGYDFSADTDEER